MLYFTFNRQIEGFVDKNVYVRVMYTGWAGQHFILREIINERQATLSIVTLDELQKMLSSLKTRGVIREDVIAGYLAAQYTNEESGDAEERIGEIPTDET